MIGLKITYTYVFPERRRREFRYFPGPDHAAVLITATARSATSWTLLKAKSVRELFAELLQDHPLSVQWR